jgi:glyoxylase-like metal-dependent hydrolase (beta-lactamase superfamily II)
VPERRAIVADLPDYCGAMSGHRHHDHDHPHGRSPRLLVPRVNTRSRRTFLGDIGGAMALAVTAPAILVACSSDSDSSDSDGSNGAGGTTQATESDESSTPADDEGEESEAETGGDAQAEPVRWARTNLGFVSAYVLARGSRAAVVDTGTEGSADAIGASLQELGLTFNDVERIILTHKHGDHIGSITEVLSRTVNATAYAGEADLDDIAGDISPLVGGEDIFGFEILATPGHTAGHMAVIDHGAGILVAGDALTTEAGAANEPPDQFTADGDQARESIRALARLTFNTLLVGHGDPLESGAEAAVAALVESFG